MGRGLAGQPVPGGPLRRRPSGRLAWPGTDRNSAQARPGCTGAQDTLIIRARLPAAGTRQVSDLIEVDDAHPCKGHSHVVVGGVFVHDALRFADNHDVTPQDVAYRKTGRLRELL